MTRIENEIQYRWALAKVDELLALTDEHTPADHPYMIELKLISDLVADYSDEHFTVGAPTLVDVIKLRMYEMGLSQTALAELLNVSKSRISDYLNGRSEPTLKVGREISKKLNIDSDIVLGL